MPDIDAYKTSDEKLIYLDGICHELDMEDRQLDIRAVAFYGLKVCSDNPKAIAVFNYFLGYSHELTSNDNSDSAAYYYSKALPAARKGNQIKLVRSILCRYLFLHHTKETFHLRDSAAAELQTMLDTAQDDKVKFQLLSVLGGYYIYSEKNEKSLQYLLKGAEIGKRLLAKGLVKDSSQIGSNLTDIAMVYSAMGLHEKSIEYQKQSKNYFRGYLDGYGWIL